ncbi:MAG: RNA-binding S4 domain-containing protein [Thermoanaerobaculia bacterium]
MEQPRIDLWLKHVCLVKHRAEATEACRGGLVKLNGQRVKPASTVRLDDVVELSEPHYRKVVVLAIPGKQAAKDAARAMYRDETPPPEPSTSTGRGVDREPGAGRPSKRERRDLERWRGR